MITRWGVLARAPELTSAQFAREWLGRHAPVVASGTPGLRHYAQNIVVDSEQRSPFPRGTAKVDGFSQLAFDTLDEMREGMATLASRHPLDLAHFSGQTTVLCTVGKVDRPPPEDRTPLLKRISLLRRRAGTSAEEFHAEWWGKHSELVAAMPGYLGYTQHLVVDRLGGSTGASYAALPVDGIVEFWFRDLEEMTRCYASPEFERTAAHGRDLLDEVTTYLVREEISVVRPPSPTAVH